MDDLVGEPAGLLGGVGVRDTQQDEQAGPDRADDFAVDRDAGPADALDDGPHDESTGEQFFEIEFGRILWKPCVLEC